MIAGTYRRLARYPMVLTVLAPLAFVAPAPSQPVPVDALQWDRRILIVFSPDRSHPALSRQRRLLNAQAMTERDLHIVEVIGESVSGAREYAGRLRQRYGVGVGSFETLLIGKDGGVKLRSTDAVPMAKLAATIDAMPMRRGEIARQRR